MKFHRWLKEINRLFFDIKETARRYQLNNCSLKISIYISYFLKNLLLFTFSFLYNWHDNSFKDLFKRRLNTKKTIARRKIFKKQLEAVKANNQIKVFLSFYI